MLFLASSSSPRTTSWLRQLRMDPIQSSSHAPLPSEVPDSIVTIETSKMTLALQVIDSPLREHAHRTAPLPQW